MSQYDLKSLSGQDFEELVRDLLQAEWNVPLEAFKAGRDSGIDLRYSTIDGGDTIVQCKHYIESGFPKLLGHLRHSERPKIEKLCPRRYVIATSVGLTPSNKDKIVSMLRPFVLSASDVLGAADLAGLLSRHPTIERRHFKLWLTSTSVVERVLHNAEMCHAEFSVDRIRRKLRLFVQSEAVPRAMQILGSARIVVISGVPGIGKTTLAEMLMYAHLEQGYEPVVIQAEIVEGRKLFNAKEKQIFYFDDFLGQAFLSDRGDYLGRNQDVALVDFMEMVRCSNHARFILTTREHILQNALQASERLAQSSMMGHRCVVELSDYSYGNKARILYNHLYFSELPVSYKRAVLRNDFFLEIVKHEHFNPRLIEWLSTYVRVRSVAPSSYQGYIERLLQNPHEIWSYAFRNQISHGARDILLSLYTLGTWVDLKDLEPSFITLHRSRATKYNYPIAPGDFRRSLQELDGAFLYYRSGHASYINPSVREFVASTISEDRDTAEDLVNSAVRFKQIANLWKLSLASQESGMRAFMLGNANLLRDQLSRLMSGPSVRWKQQPSGGKQSTPIDMPTETRISFLAELAAALTSPDLRTLAWQALNDLISDWQRKGVNFDRVLTMLKTIGQDPFLMDSDGSTIYRNALDTLTDRLDSAWAQDWAKLLDFANNAPSITAANQLKLGTALSEYCQERLKEERWMCSTSDELVDLHNALTELGAKSGFDLSSEIDVVEGKIAEYEDSPEPKDEETTIRDVIQIVHHEDTTDEDIKQMFGTVANAH